MKRIIDNIDNGELYICRDPFIIYRALSEHIISSSDKAHWQSCGVIAEVHINLLKFGEGYSEYLVDVVSYLRVEPSNPSLVARICRSENMFVESMIMSTRVSLIASGPSKSVDDFCTQYRYVINNAGRLSTRSEIQAALAKLVRGACI
jgi:hypothetical protein